MKLSKKIALLLSFVFAIELVGAIFALTIVQDKMKQSSKSELIVSDNNLIESLTLSLLSKNSKSQDYILYELIEKYRFNTSKVLNQMEVDELLNKNNCESLNDSQVCKLQNDHYISITPIKFSGKTLGFLYLENELTYQKDYKEIVKIISAVLLITLLFNLIAFFTFLARPLRNDIEKILKLIGHETDEKIETYELNQISEKYKAISINLKDVQKKNIEFAKTVERESLSSQVVHDIISPLTSLDTIFHSSNTNLNPEEQRIASQSLERIHNIIDSLKEPNNEDNRTTQKLSPLLERIVEEKRNEYINREDIKIHFLSDPNLNDLVKINRTEFFRSISNIINNAVQAKRSQQIIIEIALKENGDNLELSINDNGSGIDEKNLNKILERGFSTKANNKGLGLSQVQRFINSSKGDLSIKSIEDMGTKIKLTFPRALRSNSAEAKEIILIDDDEIIRLTWKLMASKQGMKLHAYSGVEEFLKSDHSTLDKGIPVYIDSYLGEELSGEEASQKLQQLGFNAIFLVTGKAKSDCDLSKSPWIKDVRGKDFPFQQDFN